MRSSWLISFSVIGFHQHKTAQFISCFLFKLATILKCFERFRQRFCPQKSVFEMSLKSILKRLITTTQWHTNSHINKNLSSLFLSKNRLDSKDRSLNEITPNDQNIFWRFLITTLDLRQRLFYLLFVLLLNSSSIVVKLCPLATPWRHSCLRKQIQYRSALTTTSGE